VLSKDPTLDVPSTFCEPCTYVTNFLLLKGKTKSFATTLKKRGHVVAVMRDILEWTNEALSKPHAVAVT